MATNQLVGRCFSLYIYLQANLGKYHDSDSTNYCSRHIFCEVCSGCSKFIPCTCVWSRNASSSLSDPRPHLRSNHACVHMMLLKLDLMSPLQYINHHACEFWLASTISYYLLECSFTLSYPLGMVLHKFVRSQSTYQQDSQEHKINELLIQYISILYVCIR